MDQNIDNRHKEILWDLLANPAENGQLYKHNLERLVQDNPQSGLLQVMYARASQTPDTRRASAYFSPKVLHKIMHDPDGLLPVSRERLNKQLNGRNAAEPENFFNIGAAPEELEALALLNDEAVANNEDLLPQALSQPEDILSPVETAPEEPEEQQPLPQAEEEQILVAPATEYINEPVHHQPEIEQPEIQEAEQAGEPQVAAENEVVQPQAEQPILAAPDIYPTAAHEPQQVSAYQQPTHHADEDDEEANPWDFSKLDDDEPQEIEVFETGGVTAPEPIIEHQPEIVIEKPAEAEPIVIAEPAVVAPSVEEPRIETYDHSLSAFEHAAIKQAEEIPAEDSSVSSFDNYRPENVFHRQNEIEDEVFDEIVSIDAIGVETISNKFAEDTVEPETVAPEPAEEDVAQQQSYIDSETEKLIYGNIAATDYLSFDKKLDELRIADATPQVPVDAAIPAATVIPEVEKPSVEVQVQQPVFPQQSAEAEQQIVSKYNDDTMPYSFMWWLDKTRKEHAATQPYAAGTDGANAPDADATNNSGSTKENTDELQQQYYANIFSLTSVSSIGDIAPPQIAFDHSKKEDIIIERFIHTDPAIKPLSADKLDNENKAKRSSEDQDVMVTETLARIYGDQMLYHKAIATYKKLMLKIPEKKLYFAAQIEQLEKKIN